MRAVARIRDYVHVEDLATAHVLALSHLRAGGESDFLNLGSGCGFSVRQVIEAARRITGRPIESVEMDRRAGDPPELVARADRAGRVLGWRPEYANLDMIIRSAWAWHLANPHGYLETVISA